MSSYNPPINFRAILLYFFIFITHLEEKRTRFAESSSSNIKRLISYAAPESKKVDKICCQLALPKLMGNTYIIIEKQKKPCGSLICRLTMSFAERWSSEFHTCPRSFAYQANMNFSDNISAVDVINRHTSSLKGWKGLLAIYFTRCAQLLVDIYFLSVKWPRSCLGGLGSWAPFWPFVIYVTKINNWIRVKKYLKIINIKWQLVQETRKISQSMSRG